MPTFAAEQLRKVCSRILEALGVPRNNARRVAYSLVTSNLVGHDSHGIMRLPEYVEFIRNGRIKPRAKIVVVRETPSTSLLDGKWGFGQIIAQESMKIAIKKAKAAAISSVGAFHCNHMGRLGEYSLMAAESGMIGLIMCNSGFRGGIMAPYGGKARRLGNNPMSVAIPTRKEKTFLLDFATSVVSEGTVRLKHYRREEIPADWILDKDGHPTINPTDLYRGGMLLPFGAHKGYGLALLVEILGGALVGAGFAYNKNFNAGSNGVFMIVIDIGSFMALDEFTRRVDKLLRKVKQTPCMSGHREILIPGERGFRTKEQRLKEGIYISDETWRRITKVAEDSGLDLEKVAC